MSLRDLGKNDISEETQALKDRLASRDTENAGLRTQLMKREAELEELQATLNETVYKLSKEAERALQLEGQVSMQSSELKTERMSLRNTELALQSAQEKLKVEERAKRELESTLDTISVHSQATSAEHQSVQHEKRALESRVRELERIVQTHEANNLSNIPRKTGRSRSSSVSNFRLPAMEQELGDIKAQLHTKDTSIRSLEQKLSQAQSDLVKAENTRISMEKAGQKRISELSSALERKEEEFELLRETDSAGEREEELLKRIDEDAAKITAMEKLVSESQVAQSRVQKLQSQLKAECDKVHHSEDLQSRLLREKEELSRQYVASQSEIEEGRELLMARERQIRELETKYAHLVELGAHRREELFDTEQPLFPFQRSNGIPTSDQSALADHIQTLLQAIDRLRAERDELKRALEFSEVEYRITMEGFQSRIALLTSQLAARTHDIVMGDPPVNAQTEQRMRRLASCAATFAVVISNLQTNLELSESRVSTTAADLASFNDQLHGALAVIDSQKQSLDRIAQEKDVALQKLDSVTRELEESDEERGHLRLRLTSVEEQVITAMERARTSEGAREEVHQSCLLTEQRFAALNKSCQDIESERNSLALLVTNLQDDLGNLRDELADAQHRYNILQAQQLSEMSTSQVVQALKDRIQELEARITQYTSQMGDYQHDIRRLEANLKLQEERIAEMTSELDLLASQKEAMVEDCAEAREARDKAIGRSEAAEEEIERFQQRLQQAEDASEAQLSEMSLMVADLKSENQQTAARLADLGTKNARLTCELDTLGHDHRRLDDELNTVTSHSCSLELENARQNTEIEQAVISLAIVHRDAGRRLQSSYQHIAALKSQILTLTLELQQIDALISSSDKVQEKEQELAAVRQLLEETRSRHSEVEAELMARISKGTMESQEHARQVVNSLQQELENTRTRLETSEQKFADLEKLHDDVIQDFTAAKEVLERRVVETEDQICILGADRHESFATMEAKYRHETDILANDLENREHEIEELRQELQNISETHIRTEGKLREELKSSEVRHSYIKDLEEGLRDTIADLRQQLARAETDVQALEEERQSLQAEITSFQAESQRSASLTRYLENQARESEHVCMMLKEDMKRLELSLAESEKAGKVAEFNFALQATQHEKVVAAFRREIMSLQSGPELHSTLADLEEKNREMDSLLRAKCEEIEGYDDRILETLKANKKMMSKVDALTRKVQALQTKLSVMKAQPREPVAEAPPPKKLSPSPLSPVLATSHVDSHPSSSRTRESSPSLAVRSKTPEPRLQAAAALPSLTPSRPSELSESEKSAGKKRRAPDDDERDGVPAEGHYSTDACLRNGPTPRLRRAHGHPAGFTPVRGASLRKVAEAGSPGRRTNAGMTPSEVITDVTNNPRGPSGQGDGQLKKRSWLGKIRGGAGSQPASTRMGTFGGR